MKAYGAFVAAIIFVLPVNNSLPETIKRRRERALSTRTASGAIGVLVALFAAWAVTTAPAFGSDASALPLVAQSPRPHAAGDVFNYSLHGTLSQAIVGRDPFGRMIHQTATPTDLQGRERIAVKFVTAKGLSLHRSGSILATFNGKSSPAQSGTGWTLVTPEGNIEDRKGSTLGGLFLLPLGFLAERAINGGLPPSVGDTWDGKLGTALFGMTAQPWMRYRITGTRRVFGITVDMLSAYGSAAVKEPIVTNDGVALGNALGIARVSLRCDYDPQSRRAVSMAIDVTGDLLIHSSHRAGSTKVRDHQHYLVALDAASIPTKPAADPPAPKATLSPPSFR